MKRKSIAMALIAALTLSLVGCGSAKGKGQADGTSQAEVEKVTVEVRKMQPPIANFNGTAAVSLTVTR